MPGKKPYRLDANDTAPCSSAFAVTPHDTNELPNITRGLYIGSGGNVVVTMDSSNITFANVPAGTILPIECSKVLATGTTASNIVALW